MRSIFVREKQPYTMAALQSMLECGEAEVVRLLRVLSRSQIVKWSRKTADGKTMSDLTLEEAEINPEEENARFYEFDFVGVVAVRDIIFKCYPKYLKREGDKTSALRQALHVIDKYKKKRQEIKLYEQFGENRSINTLAIELFLLRDYDEYGLYRNFVPAIECDGTGEILWDKTVNQSPVVFADGVPYYSVLYTRKRMRDEQDFFQRLHACILDRVTADLKDAGLLELFGLSGTELSDETISDFGELDYILYRIDKELNVQFNTRKQQLLKAIESYLSAKETNIGDSDSFELIGTNSFNMVWEDVCNQVLGDERNVPLGNLHLPQRLAGEYDPKTALLSVLERPAWKNKDFSKVADQTLRPDYLAVKQIKGTYWFVILDAKYYDIQFEADKPLAGQPGTESIIKQYMYELSYKKFRESNGLEKVFNCFLLPTEEDQVSDIGWAEFAFLNGIGLQHIEVRLLPAGKMFSLYLDNKQMDITELGIVKQVPIPSVPACYSRAEPAGSIAAEIPPIYGK